MYKRSLFYVSLFTTPTLISAAFKAALPQITPAVRLPHARRQDTCPAGWYACPTDGGCCEIGNSCSTNDAGIPICIVPECDPGIVACTEGPISGVCCLEGSTCAFSICNAGGPPPLSIPLGNGPVSISSMQGVSEPVVTDATPTPTEAGPGMSSSLGMNSSVQPTETGDGAETASTKSGGDATPTESGDDTTPTDGSTGSPMTTMGNTRTTSSETASDAPQSTGEASRADSKWGNIVGGLVGMVAMVL